MPYIDELQKQQALQKQGANNTLTASRDKTLGALNVEKQGIGTQFYNDTTAQSTASQLEKKNFAEFMAGRGGSSGTNNQAELLQNNSLQKNLGGLKVAETNSLNDVNRRVAGANTDYNTNLASAYNTIDTNYVAKLAEYQQQQEQLAQQRAYEQQQAQQERAFQQQQAARASASKSNSNGVKATTGLNSAINKSIANVDDMLNGDYNLSVKVRTLSSYLDELKNQGGEEAQYMAQYTQQALDKANQQMSDYVNVGRYAGYENRR